MRFTTVGELEAWTPGGQRLPAVPMLKPEPGVVEWVEGSWDVRDGERPDNDGAFPLPLWDGEPVDYTACVGALVAA